IFGKQCLTYGELNQRANHVAHYLIAKGIGPEILVGICMKRSVEMLVAILGVLKAGGGYVPLNPTDPTERLSFVLKDTGVMLILTQHELLSGLTSHPLDCETVCLDVDWSTIAQWPGNNPKRVVGPQNQAYVMYTSGSTGEPKGVVIEHRAIVRLVCNTNFCRF